MAKGRRLALFKIKQRGQSILQTPQRTLATEAHILGSRAACLVLFLSKGHVCPFLCHSRWLPGLPTTAVWTMDNAFIPGLAKGEGGHARHGPVPIFLLFPAFGRHLKRRSWGWRGWQCQDLASSPPFLHRSHSLRTLKGIQWKKKPSGPQACCRNLLMVLTVGTFQCVSCKLHTAP